MAKIPITISIRLEDLERLDAFAGERRLTRGDAVGMLLDERQDLPGVALGDPEYIPPPPNRTRLDRAREGLARAEAKVGAEPVLVVDDEVRRGDPVPLRVPEKLKTRDPYSQVEEYPGAEDAVDDPSPDVQDQRRKGRRG